MKPSRRTAFSLIEVLVVIAVIAILTAVLLPATQRCRELARQIRCRSNLAQITTAWHLYAQDHDGRFCRGNYLKMKSNGPFTPIPDPNLVKNPNIEFGGWKGGSPGAKSQLRPLNPYLGLSGIVNDQAQARLFHCPSDQGGQDYRHTAFFYFGNSYETNHMIIGPVPPLPRWHEAPWDTLFQRINLAGLSLKSDQVKNPAKLLFVGDHNWRNHWDPLNTWVCADAWHKRHHHYNLSFFDGHVAHTKIEKGICINDAYRIHPDVKLDKIIRSEQVKAPCQCGRN